MIGPTMTRLVSLLSLVALAWMAGCESAGEVGADSAAPTANPGPGYFFDDGGDFDELLVLERSEVRRRSPYRISAEARRSLEQLGYAAGPGSNDDESPAAPPLPGTGDLRTTVDDELVSLPLERTDVHLDVLGPVVAGTVRQRFTNPYTEPIEAVYVFPLPHDAAVHDFVLTVGERRIRGIVREREEARRIYDAARAQGHTAALLTSERPNIFTQNVANLVPGAPIDVELAYLEPVDHDDGWQELAFPMVVGPRYNPVGHEGGIGAKGRRDAPTGQPTDVTYLRPEERSGHDISLSVDLRAGLGIERIASPTHAVTIEERPEGALVRLSPKAAIPNADFRLRWRVAGDGVRAGLVRQGDHALLTIHPPADLKELELQPIEHVFVLDTSGSMNGEPLAALKRAMRVALDSLQPRDTFHLLHFSNSTGALANDPLAATPENLRRARAWLDRLQAEGGTEMLRALQAALARPSDGDRPRVVTFMTDGYVGNEDVILHAIQTREADARIFSFGIGSSPNAWLMSEMAKRSGGAAAYVGIDEDPRRHVQGFFDRASRPAVQDLRLTWTGADARPAQELPRAMLCGRPLSIPVELMDSAGPVSVRVEGRVQGAWRELASSTAIDASELGRDVLSKVWGRTRLSQLAADARVADAAERDGYHARMRALALEHGLVSSFTSFIAVDSAQKVTDGGEPARVDVAVPLPAGVEYERTVSR